MIRDRPILTSRPRALNDSSSVRNFPIGCLAGCVAFAKKAAVSTTFCTLFSQFMCAGTFKELLLFRFLFFLFKIVSANGIPQRIVLASDRRSDSK